MNINNVLKLLNDSRTVTQFVKNIAQWFFGFTWIKAGKNISIQRSGIGITLNVADIPPSNSNNKKQDTYQGMFKLVKDTDTTIKVVDGANITSSTCGQCLVTDVFFNIGTATVNNSDGYIVLSSEYDMDNTSPDTPIIQKVTNLTNFDSNTAFVLLGRVVNGVIVQEINGMAVMYHMIQCTAI